jgi:hypothetical protein
MTNNKVIQIVGAHTHKQSEGERERERERERENILPGGTGDHLIQQQLLNGHAFSPEHPKPVGVDLSYSQ